MRKEKRLITIREGVHGYIPCVRDRLSSRTAPKESSVDHFVPPFAISSKLVPILRVNVENRHSFFHRSAIGHLCGTSTALHLGEGSHEESMRLGRRSKGIWLMCPSHRNWCRAMYLFIESKPNSFSVLQFFQLRRDGSRCGVNLFGSLFSHSEREIGATLYTDFLWGTSSRILRDIWTELTFHTQLVWHHVWRACVDWKIMHFDSAPNARAADLILARTSCV